MTEIRPADWTAEQAALTALRMRVFVEEQGVPAEEEIDGLDPDCQHVVAETADGRIVGTGRLRPDGRIGRMAVERNWRGRGIGRALLEALVQRAAAQGLATVELHAQCHALGFYAAAGFRAVGPEFEEAGIPHRRMRRVLGAVDDGDERSEGHD